MKRVLKKDGTVEIFDGQKIVDAVNKSAERAMVQLKTDDFKKIVELVEQEIENSDFSSDDVISVKDLHFCVEAALEEFEPKIAKSYKDYRNYKVDFIHMMDKVYQDSQKIMYLGDKENANTDSTLVATKRSLTLNCLEKELYKKFFLTKEELQACKDGYIYVHDMSARRNTMNCCLFNMAEVLKGGFEMGNLWYNEPKTLDVAFDVMGDVIFSAASQQYGGFTVPRVDSVLAPYAEKSFEMYKKEYMEIIKESQKKAVITLENGSEIELLVPCGKEAAEYARNKVKRDFEQGWQGLEYKLNSVGSSRGDYAFVTITFGLDTTEFGKMAAITYLDVHRRGQGKEGAKRPTLFPKSVFLYDENLHGKGRVNEDVFEAGVECSQATMYPDWLSLTGEGYVPSMYKEYGEVISPMGFLLDSPCKTS